MATNFLERNKKKSSLAALLLFLRQRKMLALLLLLVIGASTLFVTPSSFLVDLPGGTRMAAGMAWLASRMGMDVSRWGLAPGRVSFNELVSAFDAARWASGHGGRAGWGPFFTAGDAKGAYGPGSLDYVKASRDELANGTAKGKGGAAGAAGAGGAGGGGSGPFAEVVDPAQAAKDDAAVALGPNDVGGEREGFVKAAFAGGFFNGLLGGAAEGANSLSGGAYASQGFFSGSVGAASGGGAASLGLANQPTIATPPASLSNGYAGRMSSSFAHSLQARETQGAAGAMALGGGRAYTQLAEGNGQAQLATADCPAGSCPGEYAATNTGAIYDGNSVNNASTNGIITAAPVDGITSPNIPSAGQATGAINSANQMTQDAQTCQALDSQYGPQEDQLNSQMQSLSQQFQSANCGSGGCSQSKINYCKNLGNHLRSTCTQYMSVRCQHTRSCPLTASDAATTCSEECQQGGNGTGDIQQGVNVGGTNETTAP
jgi:hypothetical protein